MSESIIKELDFLGASVLTGAFILVLYDVLRIFRRVISHSQGAIGLEDFLYWLAITFFIFSMLFHKNNGAVRWFAVLGIFLGMVLYNVTLSPFLVKYLAKFFIIIKNFLKKIFLFFLKPLKKRKKGLKRKLKTFKIVIKKNKPL